MHLNHRCFCGGVLAGSRPVYFVYLDEAGVSNIKHEPWVVVAGVLISDRQWRNIETRMMALAEEYAPEGKEGEFYFHATELWSGGKILPRDTYPAERRWKALKELCRLIGEFRLPIVQGCVHRQSYIDFFSGDEDFRPAQAAVEAQIVGFKLCLIAVDGLMRMTPPDEIATITVERNSQTYQHIKDAQRSLKSKNPPFEHPAIRRLLPLERIVDSVNECEKRDSYILQLADVAAFVLKKHLQGDKHIHPYLAELPPIHGMALPSISSSYVEG